MNHFDYFNYLGPDLSSLPVPDLLPGSNNNGGKGVLRVLFVFFNSLSAETISTRFTYQKPEFITQPETFYEPKSKGGGTRKKGVAMAITSAKFAAERSAIRPFSITPRAFRRPVSENLDMGLVPSIVLPALEIHAKEAVSAIKAGRVIAVPTDTLYGFACDACSAEAINRIYEIKGRKRTSPLAICVADVSDVSRFAIVDHLPQGLLDSLLPGPVTVVLRRGDSSELEKSLNPGLDNIGVRVPDNNFIRMIVRGSGSALALTSANLSGQLSSVSIKDFEDLWQHCAYIYDGGLLPSGRAGSTVVDLVKQRTYKILRSGSAEEETMAILDSFCLEKTA